MTHVSQYLSGERNYWKFTSPTGPLVYPGLHVYIYRWLYHLTDSGTDIALAQYIFVGLYLLALSLVIITYKQGGAPPWVLPMLVMSKRLHSIFMLRLFNDGFAVMFLFAAILCYQRKLWSIGGLLFSAGLAVKMSLLLALPAVGVLILLGVGRERAFKQALIIAQVQVSEGRELTEGGEMIADDVVYRPWPATSSLEKTGTPTSRRLSSSTGSSSSSGL